ncbi:MAG: hypothetical protein AB7P14_04070 [Blastocatellales bacterium]
MSKLGCNCGGVIYDQTDNLPYKGMIIRDQHTDVVDNVVNNIASYLEARLSGNGQQWVNDHFGYADADLELDDSSIIYDLMTLMFSPGIALDIYQCEQCQRILIENRNRQNTFISFLPEENDAADILKVKD